MEYESEIKRLEDFVGRLLEGYTNLKEEIKEQQREVLAHKSENEQLRQQIEAMESERGDLGNRVSILINRIENWESELETETFNDDQQKVVADDLPAGSDEHESAEEIEDEDESGGIQGSLFSASSNAG